MRWVCEVEGCPTLAILVITNTSAYSFGDQKWKSRLAINPAGVFDTLAVLSGTGTAPRQIATEIHFGTCTFPNS